MLCCLQEIAERLHFSLKDADAGVDAIREDSEPHYPALAEIGTGMHACMQMRLESQQISELSSGECEEATDEGSGNVTDVGCRYATLFRGNSKVNSCNKAHTKLE